MGSLEQRLAAIREASAKQLPEAAQQVMHRVTEELRASGQVSRAVGEGDTAPPFALPDQDGEIVRSDELLARGPLVLTFFRGHW